MTDKEYIELDNKNPFYAQPYEGQEADKQAMVEYNKQLCEKYPFLTPRNRFSGKVPEDFDYSYTELDSLETGWRLAFGIKLCDDIKKALLAAQKKDPNGGYPRNYYTSDINSTVIDSYLDGYRILQLKEKYGSMRLYDNGAPEEVYEVINKYESLSEITCIKCGKKATKISLGWISPFCNKCAKELDGQAKFVSVKEWFEDGR